jgi:hypothetical protein
MSALFEQFGDCRSGDYQNRVEGVSRRLFALRAVVSRTKTVAINRDGVFPQYQTMWFLHADGSVSEALSSQGQEGFASTSSILTSRMAPSRATLITARWSCPQGPPDVIFESASWNEPSVSFLPCAGTLVAHETP